jgi:MinD-like ATPase involved in chromosome partitioning or flagellar assembly
VLPRTRCGGSAHHRSPARAFFKLPPPRGKAMVVTFYSFKGGVGRSMALANIAVILANRGSRVTMCDWDLEAPGLEAYFARDLTELRHLQACRGILDMVQDYKLALSTFTAHKSVNEDTAFPDVVFCKPSSYLKDLREHDVKYHNLKLLPAGCRSVESQSNYVEQVQDFDWTDFYENWAGNSYMELLRDDLSQSSDFVLVDSRTGITEQGGLCTHHLADVVVILSGTNAQHLAGAQWMVDALTHPDLLSMRGDRRLSVLPIAARVEQGAEKEELANFRVAFSSQFAGCLPRQVGSNERYFKETEIPYVPFYSFAERVAALEEPEKTHRGLLDAYAAIADSIERIGGRGSFLPSSVADVFVSYAHQDLRWWEKLRSHLSWLDKAGRIAAYDDLVIARGERWHPQMKAKIEQAEIIIILISADFLASNYCASTDLSEALRGRDAQILPVLVGHCDWTTLPIPRPQVLPTDERGDVQPLTAWTDVDRPLSEIARQVRTLIEPAAAPKKPLVFLSYSRRDDQQTGGKITQLREALELAASSVVGEDFVIFQDVDGIEWGQRWQGRLDEALKESQFLIPIITPSYLRSESCRNELEKFLSLEREGQRRSILPVYFRSVADFEGGRDPLARELNLRGFKDWRHLRHRTLDDPEVQREVDEMAEELGAALLESKLRV